MIISNGARKIYLNNNYIISVMPGTEGYGNANKCFIAVDKRYNIELTLASKEEALKTFDKIMEVFFDRSVPDKCIEISGEIYSP